MHRSSTLLAVVVFLLALFAARTAGAQDPPVEVVLPVLQKFVEAPYPAEAAKDRIEGEVGLELTIDASGKVTDVKVVAPVGHGLDEAAAKAAADFEFTPARRNGAAVASKIPYRYAFKLAPAEPPPAPDAAAPAPGRLGGVVHIAGSSVPLEGARVVLRGPSGGPREIVTGPDGAWRADALPPGKYAVSVSAPGYQPFSATEEVLEGEATEVVYRISPPRDPSEVVVRGDRPPREVTRRRLEQRELARIPGTGGDALKAIQSLPGVARPPGMAGLLIVRGSAPQDTQVFVDGTLVPLVYHFGGLSSVVPTEMIEKLDFYPGNFSSQYGRVMGGIVDVGIRPPKEDRKLHAMAQADLIDARMVAEGPIPGLKNVEWVVGGRRSYVDLWLKPVLEQAGTGVTTAPVYYDYQAFVRARPTKDSSFRVGFFGSDDRLELFLNEPVADEPAIGGSLGLHTGFGRVQGVYEHQLSEAVGVRSVVAYGWDTTQFNVGQLKLDIQSRPLSARTELSLKVARPLTIHVGADLLYSQTDLDIRAPPPPRPNEPEDGPIGTKQAQVTRETRDIFRPAAFVEAEIVPFSRLRIVPGFRADYADDTQSWDLSPRINARYDIMQGYPRTTAKGGVGLYHQPPQPQETNAVFGTPGLESNRAVHYTLGVEQEITRQIDLSIEGYYKDLSNLVDRAPKQGGSGFDYNNLGSGYVVGSELLLRYKPDDRFFGWVAYTLSRSMRRSSDGAPLELFQYDQTHILTVLGSYRLGGGWEFGARFRLVSGPLYTPCAAGGIFDGASSAYTCVSGKAFSERLPMYHQLDLRIDKHWQFDAWRLSAYLDVYNVYNRRNPEGISYNYNYTQSVYQSGLPIIPSIGLRGEL